MRLVLTAALLFTVALSAQAATSATPAVGSQLPQQNLNDANGNRVTLPGNYHYVVFAADMDAADLVKDKYADGKTDPFAARNAIYVADISGMPAIISKMFAKPKMRKYPFRIALDEKGQVTQNWPRKENSLTLLQLDHGKITAINYCSTTVCLQQWADNAAHTTDQASE